MIKGLNCDDHKLIAKRLDDVSIILADLEEDFLFEGHPPNMGGLAYQENVLHALIREIYGYRFPNFMAEQALRVENPRISKDGQILFTNENLIKDGEIGCYVGSFAPWVCSRPAYQFILNIHEIWKDNKTERNEISSGPVKHMNIPYSVGVGTLTTTFLQEFGPCIIFGGRNPREVGGNGSKDTLCSGFLSLTDINEKHPFVHRIEKYTERDLVKPEKIEIDGNIMLATDWANLTVTGNVFIEFENLKGRFDPEYLGDDNFDIITLTDREKRDSKYDNIWLVPVKNLHAYVEKFAPDFGPRAALLLLDYIEELETG